MPKNKNIKKYSLNKDDLANIYGRLKIIDYFSFLIKKDCYHYIREVILPRLGVPKDWAIIHDPKWHSITVINPAEKKQFDVGKAFEDFETGVQSSAAQEEVHV